MKVSIERAALLKAMSRAQGVVERRTTIPILSNVLIEAEGDKVSFRATDLDIEILESLDAVVEQAGATTIPAHTLHEIARKLPDGAMISLTEEPGEGRLQVAAGRAQFTLAVSLHAPNQSLREELIPTAHAYPYDALLDDCRHYLAITGRRVSFEYILLGGLNDHPAHAEELADRVGGFQSHVNLIAYNPIEEEEFQRPTRDRIEGFRRVLESRGVAVSLRASRGLDQDAACGQLRRSRQK